MDKRSLALQIAADTVDNHGDINQLLESAERLNAFLEGRSLPSIDAVLRGAQQNAAKAAKRLKGAWERGRRSACVDMVACIDSQIEDPNRDQFTLREFKPGKLAVIRGFCASFEHANPAKA